MRILYLADVRFPLERANGIQSMETCHALATRGHVLTLLVRPDTEQPARDPFVYYGLPPLDRLRIERAPVVGGGATRRAAYLAFAAGRAIGRARTDLVFTRDLGVAAVIAAIPRSMRPPLVYESHGYAPEVSAALPDLVATAPRPARSKLQRLGSREARIWRDADGYVTITGALAQELTTRFGERPRLAIVPDGVRAATVGTGSPDVRFDQDGPGPRRHAGASQRRPTVAYAGHLYSWKGVDVLLEALARIPEADGVIIGGHDREPDLSRLKELASRLGITGRVTFTGLLAPRQVPVRLVAATVLVLPNPPSAISTRFTSPLKLFEYMAAGRTIVASDLPAIREVLQDDVNAVLVKAGDAGALADGIRRVLADPALAARLGRAASERAVDYSWSRRAERLDALFDQVIASR